MANYLDPNDLKAAYEEALAEDVLTNRLAKMFLLIAKNYAMTRLFVKYQPKDHLYSVFMEKMVKSWRKIKDTSSGKGIFSWITTLCHRTYLHVLIEEQKYHDRFINMGLQPDEAIANMDEASEFIKKNGGMQE